MFNTTINQGPIMARISLRFRIPTSVALLLCDVIDTALAIKEISDFLGRNPDDMTRVVDAATSPLDDEQYVNDLLDAYLKEVNAAHGIEQQSEYLSDDEALAVLAAFEERDEEEEEERVTYYRPPRDSNGMLVQPMSPDASDSGRIINDLHEIIRKRDTEIANLRSAHEHAVNQADDRYKLLRRSMENTAREIQGRHAVQAELREAHAGHEALQNRYDKQVETLKLVQSERDEYLNRYEAECTKRYNKSTINNVLASERDEALRMSDMYQQEAHALREEHKNLRRIYKSREILKEALTRPKMTDGEVRKVLASVCGHDGSTWVLVVGSWTITVREGSRMLYANWRIHTHNSVSGMSVETPYNWRGMFETLLAKLEVPTPA